MRQLKKWKPANRLPITMHRWPKRSAQLGIAITNYQAILGTHIDDIGPAVSPYPLNSASLPTSD